MRPMPEQHAVRDSENERVAGCLFPGEVFRPFEQLPVLYAAELREGSVGRLISPNALRQREHRIAAVAFLIVAVVLIAVDDDLVAYLPAFHLGADRPDDAGRIGAGDVIGVLVAVESRDRLAERGPHAVVIHAGGHPRPTRRASRGPTSGAPRFAWPYREGRGALCGWPRHTCFSAH